MPTFQKIDKISFVDFPHSIAKRYEVVAFLGSGASADVFHVRSSEGQFALKLLKAQEGPEEPSSKDKIEESDHTKPRSIVPQEVSQKTLTSVESFKFEFSLLKGLKHPHVIRIFDFGFDPESRRFFYTQELLSGHSLSEVAKQISLEQLKSLFVQSLQGLAYLHEEKILHGDLKPSNLLVEQKDGGSVQLKIIDFGISHPEWVKRGGTPSFMPPEKILRQTVDERSDLYALGVTFYEVLSGHNPFSSKNVLTTLQNQLKVQAPELTTLRPQVDPVWSALLAKMMVKNPRERISSAEAALRFLETRGAVSLAPVSIPLATWIGRDEIFEKAKAFLTQLKQNKGPQVLLLVGEAGLGQSDLLTELKYEAELMGVEVFFPGMEASAKSALHFLDLSTVSEGRSCKESFAPFHQSKQRLQKHSWILGLRPEQEKGLRRYLAALPFKRLKLRPLRFAEMEKFLRQTTRNTKIPKTFLQSLMKWSQGYPSQLFEILEHLRHDPLLVEASGKWNLAIYQEVAPSLEDLGLSASGLERLTQPGTQLSEVERWDLELSQCSSLAKKNRFAPALEKLQTLEIHAPEIFSSKELLVARGRILEQRAWIYAKQNRLKEAREQYEGALNLLEEAGEQNSLLALKIKNFVAYLNLQAGQLTEAIRQYEENARAAEKLPPLEKRQLTNNELGQAYLRAGRLEEATARFYKDLKLLKQNPNPQLQMRTHYSLAQTHTQNQKLEDACEEFDQVIQLARKHQHWEYLLRAYNGLGNVYTLEKKIPEALEVYERSLRLAAYLKDYLSQATVAQNRGTLLAQQENYTEALESLETSRHLLKQVGPSALSRRLMARACHELGEIHFKQHHFTQARAAYSEAISRSEEDPNLKDFRFYPLAALAGLDLAENNQEEFRSLYPQLVFLADDEDKKEVLSQLLAQTPFEPKVSQTPESEITQRQLPFPKADVETALDSVLKINRALLAESNPEVLLRKILQYAAELSGAEAALLLEVGETQEISLKAAFNTEPSKPMEEISHRVAEQVLTTGRPLVTADALGDNEYRHYQSVIDLKLRSIACIPIRLYEKTIALLYLTHRFKIGLFTPERIHMLEAFGDQAGLALNQVHHLAQLKQLNQQLENQLNVVSEENLRLKRDLKAHWKEDFSELVGKAPAMGEVFSLIERIAATPLSVLVLGETGTGKELVARLIHAKSLVKEGPFVALNCGALPENLMESELFGFRKGAFTGASQDKKGLLLEANGGTLFLDEVAEIPPSTQVKLLRVLQERQVIPLGDTKPMALQVRLICATHQEVEPLLKTQRLREDFYYRIAQMVLKLPALRDRPGDLILLSQHLLKKASRDFGKKGVPSLEPALLQKMLKYPWPGNVRELENFLHAALAFVEGEELRWEDLPEFMRQKFEKPAPMFAETQEEKEVKEEKNMVFASSSASWNYRKDWDWDQHEAAYLAEHLLQSEQDLNQVAADLDISLTTLYGKLKKHRLKENLKAWQQTPPQFPSEQTLKHFKSWIIQQAHEVYEHKVYPAAAALHINVGTFYRYLKEEA